MLLQSEGPKGKGNGLLERVALRMKRIDEGLQAMLTSWRPLKETLKEWGKEITWIVGLGYAVYRWVWPYLMRAFH